MFRDELEDNQPNTTAYHSQQTQKESPHYGLILKEKNTNEQLFAIYHANKGLPNSLPSLELIQRVLKVPTK